MVYYLGNYNYVAEVIIPFWCSDYTELRTIFGSSNNKIKWQFVGDFMKSVNKYWGQMENESSICCPNLHALLKLPQYGEMFMFNNFE